MSDDTNLAAPGTPHIFAHEFTVIAFDSEAAHAMLGAGWRDEESDNQLILHEATPWAASIVADMRITVLMPRDRTLTLEMQPHAVLPNAQLDIGAQAVEVTWNSTPLGTCCFKKEEGWALKTFTFDLPAQCQTRGPNTLTFSSRYAVSARQLYGEGNDGRSHAFGLKSVALTDKDAPAAPVAPPRCAFNGKTIEQSPRSRLAVPVRLPERRGGTFEMETAAEDGARVFFRTDSVSGPIENEITGTVFSLDVYRGQHVEFVFQTGDAPATWKAPRIAWSEAPAKPKAADPAVDTPYANTVLIVLDALRGDSVGHNGHYRDVTPHINALAEQGVCFSRAYAPVPYTYCSTWSLITGLYPFQHGAFGSETAPAGRTLSEQLHGAGVMTGLISANPLASHAAGYDEFIPAYEDLDTKPDGDPSLVTDPAIEFIRRHADKRFFLHLHYRQPHAPYRAPEPDFRSLSYDPANRLDLITRNWESLDRRTLIPTREQALELRARYDENTRAVDKAVAQLTEAIESLGLDEKTLVIITADHGEAFGEHRNLYTHSITVYEPVLHIPLVIQGNDIQRLLPDKFQPVASLVDIYPTICALMGLPAPDTIAGQSLLSKTVSPDRPMAFAQAAWVNKGLFTEANHWGEAFWFSRYKLIRDNGNQHIEIYDLARDSAEQHNLAQAFPVLTDYLLAQAEAWKAEQAISKRLPVKNEEEIADTEHLRALGYL